MRTPLALALLTAAGFGVGLGAGYWLARTCRPMPPPASVFSEFRAITRAGPSLASARPELWREINAELEKLRPEMDAFRKKIDAIDGEFYAQFETILKPEQRQKLADMQRRREPGREAAKGKESGKETAKEAEKEPAKSAKPAAAPTAEGAKSNPSAPRGERPPRAFFESDGLVALMVFVPLTIEMHEVLARQYFEAFYNKHLYVGQMRTRLGIIGQEHSGPEEAAKALLYILQNDSQI